MPPSSLTLAYDAVLSSTLFNYNRTLMDNISTSNALLFMIMKKRDAYNLIDDIGDRAQVPLMYEMGTADSYSGYDTLDTTPMDGITSAFFDWRQCSVPIAISGLEEEKNTGQAKIFDLLEAKIKQAELGIQDYFGKAMLQGNGGSAITTAKTSAANGSVFIDPIPLLVHYDTTAVVNVGNIAQGTYTWWRNKTKDSTSTTYAGFLKELRNLHNSCSLGPGGKPDLHVCDQNVYEVYEAALAAQHRNPSYESADIPFTNIGFRGSPVTFDEFVPNAAGGSATQSTTSGTWYMFNTQFFKMRVSRRRNFVSTPFVKPENQDAKVAHILWLGALCVMNRRKQGVCHGIDTTLTS